MEKLTLTEAARVLGISEGAVRKRYKRGKLRGETGADGRLYVWIDRVDKEETDHPEPSGELRARIEEMRSRIEDLKEQLDQERESRRRADTIIAQLSRATEEQARTIRALEAPDASRDEQNRPDSGQQGTPEGSTRPESSQANPESRRNIWRRIFGG